MQKKEPLLTSSFHQAYKSTKKIFYCLGQEQGLPIAQWSALKTLWNVDGLTISEMGEKLFIKNSTMTALIDRMERDGLVRRERDPLDRRSVRVFLSEKGACLKDSVPDLEVYFRKTVSSVLSEEEISTLILLLDKMSVGLGNYLENNKNCTLQKENCCP
ncbi:MAG TPA: MarR family transcriptional regulator [Desulfotomaculum sp.]|nr:MarR family transcriptional regulator [Desulfotomaculum sp.]